MDQSNFPSTIPFNFVICLNLASNAVNSASSTQLNINQASKRSKSENKQKGPYWLNVQEHLECYDGLPFVRYWQLISSDWYGLSEVRRSSAGSLLEVEN